MTIQKILTGSAALGVLALQAVPAVVYAQSRNPEGAQSFGIYAGQLVGDNLTTEPVSGMKPKLDDNYVVGFRYDYGLSNAWGLSLSAGRSPTQVTDVPGGNIDMNLTMVDASAEWHFLPGRKWNPYAVFGVGYAWADMDHPFTGLVNDQNVTITDDAGPTFNAGVGATYDISDRVGLRLEARYRWYDQLVSSMNASVVSLEPTVAVSWQF